MRLLCYQSKYNVSVENTYMYVIKNTVQKKHVKKGCL